MAEARQRLKPFTRGMRVRLREGVYHRVQEREWLFDRIDHEGVHLLSKCGAYGLIVRIEDIDWSPRLGDLRKKREKQQTKSLAK